MWAERVAIVNLGDLKTAFKSGEEVTLESLKAVGLCKRPCDELKVLGNGELTKKLKITAHRFSASALEKIKAGRRRGGRVCPAQAGRAKKAKRSRRQVN